MVIGYLLLKKFDATCERGNVPMGSVGLLVACS